MKRLMMAAWLMCFAQGAMAQETMVITKVKKGEEPQEVMNAIKHDFPEAITKELSYLPTKLYGDEWNVQVEGDVLSKPSLYQVMIKQGNKDYTAVYDKNGVLMSSKEVIHGAALPPKVLKTIKTFNGWHVDKVHEIIKYKGRQTYDTYRVKLQKGAEHKIVYLDANGSIIDTRFAIF